jgi:adenylate cyclase
LTERIDKETALRPDNSNAMVHGAIGLAYIGELERAKDWVTRALIIEPDDTDDRYNVACAFAQMNEPEEALTQLECCIPKMPPEIVNWMKQDSDLVPLQSHPRYLALIAEAEARLSATEAPAGT